MRVLLLGGAGFIGLHLARRLRADGHDVTVVDDFSRGRRDRALAELAVEVRSADLTDPAAYAAIERGWDQIHMLAAVVGVRNVESEPARVIRVNTLALMHLLDWIGPDDRLFFASTSEAYAGGVSAGLVPVPTPESVPLVIEDVGSPRYTYAISKLLGEAAVLHAARATGFEAVIGRFHNVYGPRMGADHVIPELSLRAARGEDPFTLYGADQSRAFCYVDDAVEAVLRLMATPAAAGRIVHIGNDAETGIGDLAKLVLRVAGVTPAIRHVPAPAGSVARRCPDLTLLRELTGFEPRVALEEGVRRTYEWYRESWTP
ncbi:UDP-glucose 4-epimerase/UDP-glucuronate decarboxylase [Nonomuraea solani]|uniref:UDP-glucose 4-epimerase/UDP-glucuronate decarboxylase n=1 Tax=Nonomuraea solani TaxID=1144553 RepID=A0A1H6CLS2_9ACTN|nr:NAD-dependent epimerase/dehydratase family protein [Nonomuraea solani]SEG73396.1 UDP-glucose 4-epimerase/UDP-glucuronate decarboxylase [Nonomuraea solani]